MTPAHQEEEILGKSGGRLCPCNGRVGEGVPSGQCPGQLEAGGEVGPRVFCPEVVVEAQGVRALPRERREPRQDTGE